MPPTEVVMYSVINFINRGAMASQNRREQSIDSEEAMEISKYIVAKYA